MGSVLIRNIDGKSIKHNLDLTSKNLIYPNVIFLKKGDVIYVPETRRSYLAKELQFINITFSGIASILTTILLIDRFK